MANLEIIDQKGRSAGSINLDEEIFDIGPDEGVVFDAIIRQRADRRQGTSAVKSRSAVRGGGKEPWRQKGTSRARQDSIRALRWHGGGIIFGSTPRSYKMGMPRKACRLAMRSVLSQKVTDKDLIILGQLTLEAPKTEESRTILDNASVSNKVLVVSDDKGVQLSGKNLPKVKVIPINGLNVVDAADYQKLVLTQNAIKRIEEVSV